MKTFYLLYFKDPGVRERYIKMRTVKKAQSSGDEDDIEDDPADIKRRKVKKLTKQQSTTNKQYNQFDNNDRSVQTTDLGLKVNYSKNS